MTQPTIDELHERLYSLSSSALRDLIVHAETIIRGRAEDGAFA